LPARLLIVSFSVCPAPDRHGVQLLNVLKALAGRYPTDVLTLRPATGDLPFVERFGKARMLRVPVGPGPLGEQVDAFRRAVKRQLEGEDYELVHVRSAWGGRAVVERAEPSMRVVYEVARSTEGEPRAADDQLARALGDEETLCLERADLVLVPTETARQHLLHGGAKPSRVVLLPPGVDIDHFDWEPPAPPDGPERVLYAGRISAGRGVRLLLQAIEKVKQKKPVKLVLAGHVVDGFQPLLDEAIDAAGLRDDVELLGALAHDDMPRVIAQAAVCVAPASPDERDRPLAGFPTKLLEYMACRRAVIAPRRPSVLELIDDGQDGLLFEPGDADDLARLIVKLLDERAYREILAEAGYARVRDEQPASATRRRLLEAYARLAPASSWSPPAAAASPVDGLPPNPETTTAKRPIATVVPAGHALGDRSGEIVIGLSPPEPPVEPPKVVVIDADDFAAAGEPRDTADAFAEEVHTKPFVLPVELDALDPSFRAEGSLLSGQPSEPNSDEETRPGPLRPRKQSG
jgi:glycosyltransferase involved in cell wall biosynthesis